jgi:catechol 2,3-dioxygenase-like lactoylglutathione lyase family enzyme
VTSIESITLEVPEPSAADALYSGAFGLGDRVGLRASEAPTSGFRWFTLSLVVSQPATVDGLLGAALDAGATALKPARKGFWGYGGVVRAPDGTICKVATSSKKDSGPATRDIDEIVLLLGVADVAASKRFYVDRGLEVARSFGRKYVQFATTHVKLALYGRRALAKDAGVSPEGTGSHRIVIGSDAGAFTDLDGFAWSLRARHGVRPLGPRRPRSSREPDPHPGAALRTRCGGSPPSWLATRPQPGQTGGARQVARAALLTHQRSDLNAARSSAEKSSGSSQAAKWPALSASLK